MALRGSTIITISALALSAGVVAALGVSPASALVTTISSSSTGLDIALTVAGIPISVGPVSPAAKSAPPPYDVTNSGSFNLPAFSLSGSVSDTASSSFPPIETGTATATTDGFSFAPAGGAIFDVTATTISSTSSVNGTSAATGSTTITDLSLTIAGQSFTFPGTQTPSANDVIFNTGGVVVTLNQQIPDTTETQGVTTNAIAINLVDFHVGSNVVNGAIDIDQSAASLAVIPEPATWVEMLVGFGAVGLLMRGRAGSAAAAKT